MIIVSYGGGTNSTALLVEAHNRGIRPDVIVFSDTGDELPPHLRVPQAVHRVVGGAWVP